MIASEGAEMEFMIDDAGLDEIRRAIDVFPISGVTSNPTILKKENEADLFKDLTALRQLIGDDRTLHVQVVSDTSEGMIHDAKAILQHVDSSVYIKIPTTEQGLKAMRELKKHGVHITATAVYIKIQEYMAIACGADYIAPYYNRMENLDMAASSIIASFRTMIDENRSQTRILAASFKNMTQVTRALEAGAHAATMQPSLLHMAFASPEVQKAIDDFHTDWVKKHGDVALSALCRDCKYHSSDMQIAAQC